MEIKGEDFIKNVQIKQEKNELEERLFELESQASNSSSKSNNPYENNNPYMSNDNYTYEEEVNKTESELDDILLGANNPSQNQDNKKKYIILGLILAVLFLITIIIFRLLSNETVPNDSFNKDKSSSTDKPSGDNIEQQYQKIVNEKLKSIEEQRAKTEEEKQAISESMDLNNIQKEEKKLSLPEPSQEDIEKANELKKDIFEVQKKEIKKEIVKPKVVEKAIVEKKEIKRVVNTPRAVTTTSKPSGIFIQVGAFSKAIDKKYLENLERSNLNYQFYKVDVKGTTFTKVIVGPYNSRTEASNATESVKKKLKVKSTFILKL